MKLGTIICPWLTAPSVKHNTFGGSSNAYTGYNSTNNKLYVPFGSSGYDNSYWKSPLCDKSKCKFTLVYDYTPAECTSLTITADDVRGRATKTTIHYEAVTNGTNLNGEVVTNIVLTGKSISDTFPQNTSYTNTVERTISFTYLGVTATTTIVQGVWEDKGYEVISPNDEWVLDESKNPDIALYEGVYQSDKHKGEASSYDSLYIDIWGYSSFQLYIRSYAEANYDYVMVSQLDQTIHNNTSYSNTTLVKAHTIGKQNSGTAISAYTLVEFTGIDEVEHRIMVIYRKDAGGDYGDDRGYVLIPKNQ
jgi:hypothetical protein